MGEKLVIIGSGPAGLTAAIYASRANLNPLVIEGFQSGGIPGGQLMTTGIVENYPGFPDGIDGQQLMANMRAQAEKMGARFETDDVSEVNFQAYPFSIVTSGGSEFKAKSVIIATGATALRLPIESEKKFWGKGISACAVCDGALPLFRNKPLAVIGGGDVALEEADYLTRYGSKVYIIHRRDQLRASKAMQKRAFENKKIEILWNKTVEQFVGDSNLSAIILKDTLSDKLSKIEVAGAFEAIGHRPNTLFLGNQIEPDEKGYISVSAGKSATSVNGVFAAGDVRDPLYRQAASAVGSGVMAALDAERWLSENEVMENEIILEENIAYKN